MKFEHIREPKTGSKITVDKSGNLIIPDNPIIPFIEGDGIGSDITPAMIQVVDSAVEKSYEGKRKIDWMDREKKLKKVLDRFRKSNGEYDVIIPGCGGKDSAYAAHILKFKYGKEYGAHHHD